MLDKFDLLSINQTSAQIKLTEAWKASKDVNYPIEMKHRREPSRDGTSRQLRITTRKEMREGERQSSQRKASQEMQENSGTPPEKKSKKLIP